MSANAGSTASLLLLLQLGSRLITFTLNQALLSFTTPAAFGTATIQLEPLLNTVLFLCREGIRATLARSSSARVSRKAVYRTSLLPLAFGIPLACAAFALYARSTAHAVAAQPHFRSSVLLYALATLVELASEPYFNRAQMAADVRLRVGIEGSAVIVRAVTTLLVILYGRDKLALLAFAIGQAAYSATLLIRYAWHYRHAQPAQSTDSSESAPDSSILKLAYALTKQSFFKQVLTEGDKVIVSRISPIEDQGGYALALNYGSLVARIIFQPLEESSRLFYSRNIGCQNDGPTKASKEAEAKADASLGLLRQLIKLQVYLTLAFTCFAPFYTTPLLFHLLRGSRWMNTSAPALLQQYLFLLPLLGLNGILEAFVQAVANEHELSRMSYALLAWSGVYCAACYACVTFLGMKEDALLWANGISMACRIAYSVRFIHKYSERQDTSAGLTRPLREARFAIVTSILAAAPLHWSHVSTAWQLRAGLARHILLGGLCFAPTLVAGLWSEKSTLQGYLARRKGTKGSKAD